MSSLLLAYLHRLHLLLHVLPQPHIASVAKPCITVTPREHSICVRCSVITALTKLHKYHSSLSANPNFCVLPPRSIVEMVRTGARVIRPQGAVGLQRQHSGGSVEQQRASSATGSGASITERVVSELRHAEP